MEYIGLTEDEMLDILADVEEDMQREKEDLKRRMKQLAMREEEIEKRMKHFESTYFLRKLISRNNKRISEFLGDELDEKRKSLFL